ncbi:MAG TPA: HmuY family protein [Gemmatimonadaceae bacterium]|nr:HmuY family protein [Gemmatimonadaceae bacterium]
MRSALPTALRRGAIAALLVSAAACGRDEATAPVEPVSGTVTVDASKGWAYLSLESGTVVTPADPLRSDEWDLAFNATNVRLNGGEGGPGGVGGFCLCQNSATGPSAEAVLAMTAESELADFTGVGAAAIPAAGSFVSDVLTPALDGWFSGAGASAAASDDAWHVRLRDSVAHAKLRVVSLQSPTAASPGRVTLEFATQASATAPLGANRTLAVDVPASGAVRVDLAQGTTTTSTTAWDIELEGWTIRVNGGASGTGKAAVAETDVPFAEITDAFIGDARAYKTDTYAGIFAQAPWYRYNLRGDHGISPTFDVYLVRRGSRVYKVQLTDYYGPAGEPRRITLRYELIAG